MKEERRRCRLREQMSSEGSERAARPAFVRPLSPRRDNEGRSSGKDVQSSLTVCVPSELRPVSSVTIQLPWPPSARHCHHGHYLGLCEGGSRNPCAHTHTHVFLNEHVWKWSFFSPPVQSVEFQRGEIKAIKSVLFSSFKIYIWCLVFLVSQKESLIFTQGNAATLFSLFKRI